uniref:CSON004559 protein n=1 Tax=Culicoides sonorensis TaxID=179676 RepID=A0A336MP91_CULSO
MSSIKYYFVLYCVSMIGICVGWDSKYGTVIFKDDMPRKCFTRAETSLLIVRQEIEKIFPRFDSMSVTEIDYDAILKYFHKISKKIEQILEDHDKFIIQTAFYDFLGGYLKSFLIPNAKISFYAGNTSLHTMRHILDLYEHCKTFLDTQGFGWKSPEFQYYSPYSDIHALSLYLDHDLTDDECCDLVLFQGTEEKPDQIIALPRLEYDDHTPTITNIWLPFQRKRVFYVRSKESAFILLRYFIEAMKCHEIEKIPSQKFLIELNQWIENILIPHLTDDHLYAAFGAVFRILRTIQGNDSSEIVNLSPMEKFNTVNFHATHPDNFTITETIQKEPLFTTDMIWITIFTISGTLLIVLLFVLMKQIVSKKHKNMRHIPSTDLLNFHDTPSTHFTRSERNSKSYLARNQPNSSHSSINFREKKLPTVSYGTEMKKKSRKSSFLSPFNVSSNFNSNKNKDKSVYGTPKSSHFKITSESESDNELDKLIETKDLTRNKKNSPRTSKNDTNL